MDDFIALLICGVALLASAWRVLYCSPCQHKEFHALSLCCLNCGISAREIWRKRKDRSNVIPGRISFGVDPFWEVRLHIWVKLVKTGERSWNQVEYLQKDAPERIKLQYREMMRRRHGGFLPPPLLESSE